MLSAVWCSQSNHDKLLSICNLLHTSGDNVLQCELMSLNSAGWSICLHIAQDCLKSNGLISNSDCCRRLFSFLWVFQFQTGKWRIVKTYYSSVLERLLPSEIIRIITSVFQVQKVKGRTWFLLFKTNILWSLDKYIFGLLTFQLSMADMKCY